MTIDQLFAAFVAEYRSGGDADPRAFLDQAAPEGRRELAALMDNYLADAPRRPLDEEAFAASGAERTVDALERVLLGQAGLWPSLLPRLRARSGLKRSELVARLAESLGVSGRKSKVAGYYHQMEQGTLPSGGVTQRVLDALGQIFEESAEALREAGGSLNPSGPGLASADATFARTGNGLHEPVPTVGEDDSTWDEVDELFRGGRR